MVRIDNPNQYQQYPNYPQQGQANPVQGAQYSQAQTQGYGQQNNMERVEEIAEAIIDEKWNALVKNINKIIEWKEKTDSKITSVEQELKDLKSEFDTLHTGVLGKIGEYDQNIINIGTEIKALEHVFQKVLPSFTENVNELSRVSSEIKDALADNKKKN